MPPEIPLAIKIADTVPGVNLVIVNGAEAVARSNGKVIDILTKAPVADLTPANEVQPEQSRITSREIYSRERTFEADEERLGGEMRGYFTIDFSEGADRFETYR